MAVAPSLKSAWGYPELAHSKGPWGGGAEAAARMYGMAWGWNYVLMTNAAHVLDGCKKTCLEEILSNGGTGVGWRFLAVWQSGLAAWECWNERQRQKPLFIYSGLILSCVRLVRVLSNPI